MSTVIKDPLGPEHLAQIKNALAIIDATQSQINKAKQAGLDMTQQQASIDDSRQKLLAVKQVYFPNQ
jgi:hypothetical protein